MRNLPFAIVNLLLTTITSVSYANPATDSMPSTDSGEVILLCKEELIESQQPIANGFLPAIISLDSGNVTYKTKFSGSLATIYKEGIYPEGTRVSGFKWYEISAYSVDGESLNFSLSYDNSLNAWGPGQLVVPGMTTKSFLTSCTAIQDLL
jgi:hypothetical protein